MFAPLLLALAAASQQPLTGVARAGDGDSLTIRETRVRLFGIDAPEFDQLCQRGGTKWECGREAADQLSKLVTGRHVFCLPGGATVLRTTRRARTGSGLWRNGSDTA